MRDDRHVSDVCRSVHESTDLVHGEVNHDGGGKSRLAFEAVVRKKQGLGGLRTAKSCLNRTRYALFLWTK